MNFFVLFSMKWAAAAKIAKTAKNQAAVIADVASVQWSINVIMLLIAKITIIILAI